MGSVSRQTIEPALTERLSFLHPDPGTIARAIDSAFELLGDNVKEGSECNINWQSWITATAMSLLVEMTGSCSWVDQFAASLPSSSSSQERRAIVFGAVLTLDHLCQAELLRRSMRGFSPLYWLGLTNRCENRLEAIVARLTVG
jgi:hypothetical protein